ncbi:MAG: acylphosphatase [Candidatus Rokubacteria bacterium]|nr:acylphosphatase [Candidatus Rokubacteria bacterium]MBI3827713.1 acylphosphatase [Candidatus Rokubacteria bacterium]
MSTPRVAAEILVSGRVHGVGFRDFAQRKAAQLGLVGFVTNLKTGQVRVYAEGPREVIEELARHLEKGPPLARVEGTTVRWLPATGRFASFGVRFAEFEP